MHWISLSACVKLVLREVQPGPAVRHTSFVWWAPDVAIHVHEWILTSTSFNFMFRRCAKRNERARQSAPSWRDDKQLSPLRILQDPSLSANQKLNVPRTMNMSVRRRRPSHVGEPPLHLPTPSNLPKKKKTFPETQ